MKMSRAELEYNLCEDLCSILTKAIEEKGHATLGLSGGSTPKNLFHLLSQRELEWNKISIFPIDERFLDDENKAQNGHLIRSTLLKNKAQKAKFIPLIYNNIDYYVNLEIAEKELSNIQKPYDIILLGMGLDGHTASLFPEINNLKEGLNDQNEKLLINTQPKHAPYKRISMTAAAINTSQHLFLHIYGSEKKLLFDKALGLNDPYQFPITAFANHSNFKIYWTE